MKKIFTASLLLAIFAFAGNAQAIPRVDYITCEKTEHRVEFSFTSGVSGSKKQTAPKCQRREYDTDVKPLPPFAATDNAKCMAEVKKLKGDGFKCVAQQHSPIK